MIFIGHWLRLPPELTDLFLETWTVTRYGQVVLSVMGFGFATILVPLVYFGKVRPRPRRAAVAAALTVAVFGLAVAGDRRSARCCRSRRSTTFRLSRSTPG